MLRNNESEEALAKKLLETQGEVSALKKERDFLKKSWRELISEFETREQVLTDLECLREIYGYDDLSALV